MALRVSWSSRRASSMSAAVTTTGSASSSGAPSGGASSTSPAVAAITAARRSSSLRNEAVTPSVCAARRSRWRGVQLQAPPVQLQQRPAGGGVRQAELHRLVDPPGPGGQRRLQHVGTVGRQDEHHVGVVGQAVHLVEQLEEQRVLAGVLAPVLRDQVDVLDHHHGRRQGARHRAGLGDEVQGDTGELDHGHVRRAAEEVTHRVGLAGAGRAVEEQAPLEVLTGWPAAWPGDGRPRRPAARSCPSPRRAGRGPTGPVGATVEAQHAAVRAEHLPAEGQHLTAKDVVLQR